MSELTGNLPSRHVEHITGMRALAYVAEKYPLDKANGLLISLRLAPDGDPAQRPVIRLGTTHEIRWDATTRDYELTVEETAPDDLPDVKVWSRKISTGVRTYRWVLAGDLEAYRAEVDADPDRELAGDNGDGGEN